MSYLCGRRSSYSSSRLSHIQTYNVAFFIYAVSQECDKLRLQWEPHRCHLLAGCQRLLWAVCRRSHHPRILRGSSRRRLRRQSVRRRHRRRRRAILFRAASACRLILDCRRRRHHQTDESRPETNGDRRCDPTVDEQQANICIFFRLVGRKFICSRWFL